MLSSNQTLGKKVTIHCFNGTFHAMNQNEYFFASGLRFITLDCFGTSLQSVGHKHYRSKVWDHRQFCVFIENSHFYLSNEFQNE